MSTRVTLLLRHLGLGGVEQNTLRLAKGLVEAGYEVDLVVFNAKGPLRHQVPPGVNVVDLDCNRVLTGIPRLIKYLRKKTPAVMITAKEYINIAAFWACWLARVDTRVIVTVRTQVSRQLQFIRSQVSRVLFVRLIGYTYRRASGVVAVSQSVASDLSRLTSIPMKRIRVIYNPITSPECESMGKEDVEHPWLQGDRNPVVLGAGRLSVEKDFATLIRAFSKVRETRDVKLLILGEGEERARLEGLVKTYDLEDSISLPGYVANPYKYMARASVFVLSSTWEGFGNVIVEALSVGTPVVSTGIGGGPSEILDSGNYGHLVEVGNSAALAKAIVETLEASHDPEYLRRRARDFSIETATEQYIQVIRAVM